jgi:putative peptide zinc metalloprotease protein
MGTALYSPSWHRVAGLRPRLRAHVRLHRQTFRDGVWHVVQDNQTGRYHRLSQAGHHLVGLMDGERTVEEIWQVVCDRLGADQPTQNDVVRLLTLLHNADLLLAGVTPHMDELADRSVRQARREWQSRVKNPLSLRFRLVDPDRFLSATLPAVRWLFTPAGFALWLLLVLAGLAVGAASWSRMSAAVLDHALTAQNILLLLATFPVVKAVHELGHAYAAKRWGGEVHELGVMLLVLMPVPYVDASASAAFPEKHRRAVVGAAGIMVEMALAALTTFVWVMAEPGLVRAIAFNVILIGGVSTLLFNGNPLLRFDGYYVLADLIEIPNLAQRANRYVFHLLQRALFGVPDLESPVTARGEPVWFVGYAVLSFLYRMLVMVGIAFLVATQFFFVGVALAILSVFMAVGWPLLKGLRYLLADPALRGRRRRALAVSAAGVALALLFLLAVPLPHATMAQGVVWVADDAATVRVGSDGMVATAVPPETRPVAAGTTLLRLEDPILAARRKVAERQLEELRIRLEAVNLADRVAANVLREQIRHSEGQLADIDRSLAEMTVSASRAGRFLPAGEADGLGRFHRKGDVVGYVVGDEGAIVRVIVRQEDIDLVHRLTLASEVRLAGATGRSLPASRTREVPAAVTELPHAALATSGGGALLLDPARRDRLAPLETVFQIDLAVPDLPRDAPLGQRAHVRFTHPPEPLAFRLGRALRQVLLRQFHV